MPRLASSSRAARASAHLGAGGQEDHVRVGRARPRGLDQHVGAPGHAAGRRHDRAVEAWAAPGGTGRCAAGSCRSPATIRQVSTTSLASAGPEHQQPRHRPQRGQLLDGLVGRAVLADPDGVVGEDVHDRDLHQRGQAHRAAGVVGEDQEARPVRPHLGQRHAVGDRRRGVLPDAEVQVAPAPLGGLEVPAPSKVRWVFVDGERSAEPPMQPRQALREGVEHLAGGVAAGDALGVGRERRQGAVPAVGQLAALDAVELVREAGVLGPVRVEERLPGRAGGLAAGADARPRSPRRPRRARRSRRPRAARGTAWSP